MRKPEGSLTLPVISVSPVSFSTGKEGREEVNGCGRISEANAGLIFASN